MLKVILAFSGILILSVLGYVFFVSDIAIAPKNERANLEQTPVQNNQANGSTDGFNKAQYSLENPESIWVVVNKKRPIPTSYIPTDLTVPEVELRLADTEEQMQIRQIVVGPLIEMFNAAKTENINLVFGSGYRSAKLQKTFYDQYVATNGTEAADKFSARPGHSEHQTGLAFDLTNKSEQCHLEICFATTPEGKWIAKNAYKYGFIIRYPNGKDLITGYQYEPWHLRYLGKDLSKQVYDSGKTLEQFFDLSSAPTY